MDDFDPTFQLTWDTKAQTNKGIAFARKRKKIVTNNQGSKTDAGLSGGKVVESVFERLRVNRPISVKTPNETVKTGSVGRNTATDSFQQGGNSKDEGGNTTTFKNHYKGPQSEDKTVQKPNKKVMFDTVERNTAKNSAQEGGDSKDEGGSTTTFKKHNKMNKGPQFKDKTIQKANKSAKFDAVGRNIAKQSAQEGGDSNDEGRNTTLFKTFKSRQFEDKTVHKPNDFNQDDEVVNIKRKGKKDKQLIKEGIQVASSSSDKDTKNYSLFSERRKNVHVGSQGGKSVSETVFTAKSFNELPIHRHLVSNLEKMEFVTLTNVQEKAIPVVIQGNNALIRSQTGSGKTLTFAVPIIDALQGLEPRLKRTDGVQAIIVVPTRELALQTHELFGKLNTFQWIVVGHLCGGENRKSEKDRIRKGINVLIGTPGRLLDHILHTEALNVQNVRCLVLDEADRLLDMGFRKDIIGIVEALDKAKVHATYNPMAILKGEKSVEDPDAEQEFDKPPLKNPQSKYRQTILLSATLNKGVSELADFTMDKHIFIDALDMTSNAILDSFIIPDTVRQEFIITYVRHRLFTLSALLLSKAKCGNKVFVFMASTQMVEFHHALFSQCLVDDLKCEFFKLHGSMDQKTRKEVFNGFRAVKRSVLLCTDVVARGIDVAEADCVIQYTAPQTDEDYLHRVGRTGRAGKTGSALIFLTHEEQDYVAHLRNHRVFLTQHDAKPHLRELCWLMGEANEEHAATALQTRFEEAIADDQQLHKLACFAYSTWTRFYNAYPAKMRRYFDFKKANMGHYVTSFALRETPSTISKFIRGAIVDINAKLPKLNTKLANDSEKRTISNKAKMKSINTICLTIDEHDSGLEPLKKKRKLGKKE